MSVRDQYAKEVLKRHHDRLRNHTNRWAGGLPTLRIPVPDPRATTHVGILGGGAAGLYAALIIDSLGPEANMTYEILEADPMTDRKGGGRLHTHLFSDAPNDYFDIGAMRFPDIPFMERVFWLLRNEKSPIAGKIDLIPYVLSQPDGLNFYNDILLTNTELDAEEATGNMDPFNTGVGPEHSVGDYIEAAIGGFKQGLKDNFVDGWNEMMKWDKYSTRSYMSLVMQPAYSQDLITYLETFNSATSLYDCALTESVMDSLDFDYGPDINWFCVQGGGGLIADAMKGAIKGPIHYGKRVTAIAPVANTDGIAESVSIQVVTEQGTPEPVRVYSHVISTMPLGCLKMVDTSECGFSWELQTAIRGMHYDNSVKVGIKFTKRWWEMGEYTQGRPHRGGSSYTDRQSRTIVYPSYGIGTQASVMLASYTWAQDALRQGAYARGKNTAAERTLIDNIINDIAEMHGMTFQNLKDMVVDWKAWNFYDDEYTAGAFALFGPSQFSSLYPYVTAPPTGLVHLAGEATSSHHAWVLGAFNSAYRTIHEILVHNHQPAIIAKMVSLWGTVDEIDDPLLRQQVALGQHVHFGRKLKVRK